MVPIQEKIYPSNLHSNSMRTTFIHRKKKGGASFGTKMLVQDDNLPELILNIVLG